MTLSPPPRLPVSRRSLLRVGAASLLAPALSSALAVPLAASLAPPRSALPRRSDVALSIRSTRPQDLDVARAFGATRLDWCYTHSASFVGKARQAGLSVVGGALNTILPDAPDTSTWRKGRVTDAAGNLVTAPWMPWKGVSWGCANSPDYRAAFLAHAQKALDAGVDAFTIDDARMNEATIAWGGCFCRHCRERALRENVDLATDLKAFQIRSVTHFHQETRAEIERLAGRPIVFSCNNVQGSLDWPYDLFDFGIGEYDPQMCIPSVVSSILRAHEQAGRPQIFTLRSRDVALNRRMIAWCYANGGLLLAPFDVYLRSTATGSDRFYGDATDYAALYAFARRLGPHLDDALRTTVPRDLLRLDAPGAEASLRAAKDGRFTALHLVRWQAGRGGRVSIDPARLPPQHNRPFAPRLLAPNGQTRPLVADGERYVADLPDDLWSVVLF